MAKTVTIPAGDNPFICKINDVYYSYPAGTTVEVPDAVAALIQANAGNREKSNGLSDIAIPRDGETGNVLTRTADGAEWAAPAAPEPELPSVSGSDNGKVLKVVEGAWAAASGGGSSGTMAVHIDQTGTLDKTWQEIFDAMANGTAAYIVYATESEVQYQWFVISAVNDDGVYFLDVFDFNLGSAGDSAFATDSADGYPVYNG